MKNKFIWLGLSFLLVMAMLLASCTTSTTASTLTSTTTTTTTTATTTTTTAATLTTPTTTTASGNWWDSLGTPTYGGTMTIRVNTDLVNWDPYTTGANATIFGAYIEPLFGYDWTLDPATFDYKTAFCPTDFTKGQLAEGYEMPDPNTVIVHLRKGIHWQNIQPANGRELTADDVVYHFDRMFGLAPGFTIAAPNVSGSIKVFLLLKSVTATNNYTVVFTFNSANIESIVEGITGPSVPRIESPDAVKQWGDLNDWHHAIGTGPFILQDFVSGASATLIKNPDYWGYDERHPQNKLPYVDKLVYLILPDSSTALAALRTGKISVMDGISATDAQQLQKTKPDLLQVTYPPIAGHSLDMRNDLVPFNNIKVRQAMQMAINLQDIATNYYLGTVDPQPQTLTSEDLTGWGFPYSQWPQDLKDQYAYNPPAAKQLLADAGYPTGFTTDVVSQDIADQSLLLIVKDELAAVNVTMNIRVMDSVSWINLVQVQKKYDQLAYKTTGRLGLDYPIMDGLPVFLTGASGNWCMVSDPIYDAAYAKAIAVSSTINDIKQAAIDINKEVAEQHFAITLLEPKLYGVSQPWLHGYRAQYNAISGGGQVGLSQAFFLARWWVDPGQ